jgi:hypothetical protein
VAPERITVTVDRHGEPIVFGAQEGDGCSAVEYVRADAVDQMRESRIARARGLAQAIAECRDDARLDGVREGAAEIVQLLGEQ